MNNRRKGDDLDMKRIDQLVPIYCRFQKIKNIIAKCTTKECQLFGIKYEMALYKNINVNQRLQKIKAEHAGLLFVYR